MKRKFLSITLGLMVTMSMISGSLVANAADSGSEIADVEDAEISEGVTSPEENANKGSNNNDGYEFDEGETADKGNNDNDGYDSDEEETAEDAEDADSDIESDMDADEELSDEELPDEADSVVTDEEVTGVSLETPKADVDISNYIKEKFGINRTDYTLYAITTSNEWISLTELEDGVGEALYSCWGDDSYFVEITDGMIHVDDAAEISKIENRTGWDFIIDWENGVLVRM